MLGHEGVIRALTESLKAHLPGVIADMRTELGATAEDFPTPDNSNIHPSLVDVVSIGNFPTLMVIQEDSEARNTARQIDSDGQYDEYQWRYPIRVVIHNMGRKGTHSQLELQRKRLMLAVRICVLKYRVLLDSTENAQVIPETIRENFTGGQYDRNANLLLESYVRLEVLTQERLDVVPGPAPGDPQFSQTTDLIEHPEAT